MKLRFALRLTLPALTVAAAGASAVSGSLWVAAGLLVCAASVAAFSLAKAIPAHDIPTLFETLRLSRKPDAAAVRAVVTSTIIFVSKSDVTPTPNSGYVLLFRDEMEAPVWRELSTLLRHQPHDPQELAQVDRHHPFRFGKSSDL